ncbi:MAG: radical SAM protein, partial [Pseudomonadota bacterium]
FTGGEPFMNPHVFSMIERALERGASALVLTNAMQPMMRPRVQSALSATIDKWGARIALRVSLDHYSRDGHDAERGAGAFDIALKGLSWLSEKGASLSIAGRSALHESEDDARRGFQALFDENSLDIDAADPEALVLFPEMETDADPPEITTKCWTILNRDPADLMCASSRMAVKRKSAEAPSVLACTLIPYSEDFELGGSLEEAARPVKLNHPHCATFCVLGGSSCSG